MPDSAANSNSPSDPPQAATLPLLAAPPSNHHGAAVADAGALPPTVTPATTTRQSVALGVFSTLWGTSASPAIDRHTNSSSSALPTIATHEPDFDTQGGPSDLAASTGSVPSATTTLTNTLPPMQSAALRALNAPAFHSSPTKSKSAKSTSSRTTVTSQPVVVRTYSGSRHNSRPGSGFNTPRSFAMNGHTTASALSAGLAGRSEQLPSADDFSFSAILRAVDPEIRDAIDAIAEICARSRMSLADEYDSHLPPQGEITLSGPGWAASTGALVGRGRLSRVNQGWAAENTLMAVPEASSSSERLAQDGKVTSSKKRSQSAYGSLKSVISGGSGKRKALDGDTFRDHESETRKKPQGPAWAVPTSSSSSSHPAITLVTSPTASKHLSLESPSGLDEISEEADEATAPRPQTAAPQRNFAHRRGASTVSLPASRMRSGTLSSIASWLPWPRPPDLNTSTQQELARAENRLREMLLSSENIGKGKAPVSVI
ncbi:hypothetical protein FB567DRAFT_127809 [Paraphoma chrysanthemicola]|uniref:Uncharacterized protein n=1 Tax=Paraphoma chrysanthemicola TaxID=798071 RepID=A0A8K0QZF1_9PLEO|nr:hypothetical protein FB567DRAFT_127809 [Paraphoma chrysanthemicola]